MGEVDTLGVLDIKREIIGALKGYQARNEHSDATVNHLRSDYGGEYEEDDFGIH